MKTIASKIIAITLSLCAGVIMVLPHAAHAQNFQEGQCVAGVSKMQNNRAVFTKQIKVYANPTAAEHKSIMTEFDMFYVGSIVNGRVQLIYAPGFDEHPSAGKVFGWVGIKDIMPQNMRDCV